MEAGGVCEVGCVGVRGEFEVCVGGVDGVDFGCKIPEAVVVCHPYGREVLEEGFGSFWRGWCVVYEAKAVRVNLRNE